MLTYVERRADLARQWYTLEADLLGTPRLSSVDEHVAVAESPPVSWATAIDTVLSAFDAIDPRLAATATEVINGGTIDALPRIGKPANAFCFDAGRSHLPLISMNFTGQPTDVLNLAHELGHAVHFVLSGRQRSGLSYDGCTIIAETAATLLELVVRQRMTTPVNDVRLLPPSVALQASIDTIFRQVMLTRFEERAYAARAAGDRRTPSLLTHLWREVNHGLYGDALDILPSFDLDWMRIEHFIQSRFYNYSYIVANLCGLAVGARLTRDPAARADVVRFLGLGGSAGTDEQLRVLGLDLNSDDLWSTAMREISALLAEVHDQSLRPTVR